MLPRLRDITGESVQLYRRDGSPRVCVAAAEPAERAARHRPGGRAAADDRRLGREGAGRLGRPGRAAGACSPTRASPSGRCAEVRRRGWAQSVAEREAGVASVSAPVRDARGQVVAAVSVSGPVERIGRRPGVRWAADLLAAAEALHHRL